MDGSAQVGLASVRSVRSPSGPRFRSNPERSSLLWEVAPVLGELAARYPDVADEVIRQQAIDVLVVAQGNQVSAALVARLVEARILALM